MNPKISVVMPYLNAERYLESAIKSILDQSFGDFELILIDDGSTDSSEKIAHSFSDERIVHIKNEKNLGLSKSFNIGIKAARGICVARMDADDISLPHRFETQYNYLEENKEIGVLGSAMILVDENGRGRKVATRPAKHRDIKWQSLFSNPIFHPTVMARAWVLKKHSFDDNLYNSEDYALWSSLLFDTQIRLANLSEPLILYRVHKKSFTKKLDRNKKEASARVAMANIEHYTKLSDADRNLILKYRREERLGLVEFLAIWKIVKRVAKSFGADFKDRRPIALGLAKGFFKQYLR